MRPGTDGRESIFVPSRAALRCSVAPAPAPAAGVVAEAYDAPATAPDVSSAAAIAPATTAIVLTIDAVTL